MNLEGIKKIETELQIKLPESYKKAVLDNPIGDKTKFNLVWMHFYDDPNELIKINKRLKKQGLQKKEWLNNLFAIAYHDGEYVFIKTDDEEEIIYIADRGTYKYNPLNLEENRFKVGYKAYLSTFIFLQQMKINEEKREINGEQESEIDLDGYLNKWDTIIRNNNRL